MENFTHLGYEVTVSQDADCDSPLEWLDNDAVLISYHRRKSGYRDESYKYCDVDAIEQVLRNDGYVPYKVFLYEHGQSLYKVADENPFNCRWDSGWFGYIALSPSLVNKKRKCKALRIFAEGIMENYTTWVNGEVMCYEIVDKDGERVDSCAGYFDFEHLKSDAIAYIETING